MHRLRLEVTIHLSEFEKHRPLTFFAKETRRLRLEVAIHLREFEKHRPLTFFCEGDVQTSLRSRNSP